MASDPITVVVPEPEETSAQPFERGGVLTNMEASAVLDRDTQLMLQVRAGDETSFALLLERHRGPVVHFTFRMVQNQAISEELAQEVFLRIYKSRQKYEPTAKFTTWLYRIATHLALNWIRDNRKIKGQQSLDQPAGNQQDGETERQWATSEPSVEEDLVRDVRTREIRSAIYALPEKQRAAVLMHKYEGLGYAQISKALDCSESATKSLLFRAYESLRVRLAHLA